MTPVVIYLLLMLGNHGSFRLQGTYLHKTACEAAAKENNSGFSWYGKPDRPGEWQPWEARCLPYSGKAPPYLSNFDGGPTEIELRNQERAKP
jgi:hypothetical protein